jgi:hypothetical protein
MNGVNADGRITKRSRWKSEPAGSRVLGNSVIVAVYTRPYGRTSATERVVREDDATYVQNYGAWTVDEP